MSTRSPSPRSSRSPLAALAWGFVALAPLPLVALFFAGDSELARNAEIGLALCFALFAAVFFVAARRDESSGVEATDEDER